MWYMGEEEVNVQHTGEVPYMVETLMRYGQPSICVIVALLYMYYAISSISYAAIQPLEASRPSNLVG